MGVVFRISFFVGLDFFLISIDNLRECVWLEIQWIFMMVGCGCSVFEFIFRCNHFDKQHSESLHCCLSVFLQVWNGILNSETLWKSGVIVYSLTWIN